VGGQWCEDPLALDPQTMRELGYRMVERLERERGGPPLHRATPAEMRERLHGPPPEEPEPFDEIIERLSGSNLEAGSGMEAAGAGAVELEVLGWFKDWIGYPPDAAGSLVSDRSTAHLTAFACARETLGGGMRDDLVLYISDQAHSSVAQARGLSASGPTRCASCRATTASGSHPRR
jgi:hypothetical protein